VRTDDNLARRSFRFSGEWKRTANQTAPSPEIDSRLRGGEVIDGKLAVHSLSGHERNKLFINEHGADFQDLSALSGIDTAADSRGFVLWDYDHDGWQDIAVVNANTPLLNLYHNEMGRGSPNHSHIVAIRFVGHQSNRNGIGAKVILTFPDGKRIFREHRAGEGYASQNSATMLIGLGEHSQIASLTVRWPSGKEFSLADAKAGAIITAHESDDSPFTQESYAPAAKSLAMIAQKNDVFPIEVPGASTSTQLRIYTTTATWCAACIKHLPHVKLLKDTLASEGVEFIGVPIDEDDTTSKLQDFMKRWKPSYSLLAALPYKDRKALKDFLETALPHGPVPLPTTVIADAKGNVYDIAPGMPSVSKIRKILAELR
jgi:thiol-disulfide isomerase/thioredoxin